MDGGASSDSVTVSRSFNSCASSVSRAAPATLASSLSTRKTRTSSRSAVASGNNPRAAAMRALSGAPPEIIDWTTGLVEVIVVVKVELEFAFG